MLQGTVNVVQIGIPRMFVEFLWPGPEGYPVIRDYRPIDFFQKLPDPYLAFFTSFVVGHQVLPRWRSADE
jgi:hypothetical protein